jgi:hypothetical protein
MGNEPRAPQDVAAQFREAGFEVAEVPHKSGALVVRKNNCVHYLERDARGAWVCSARPFYTVQGLECRLEDRGYQKFWYHEGKRFPVRVSDLRTLHHFDEEVRALLGLKSLFHEALGTTSSRSAYDRLDGRPD